MNRNETDAGDERAVSPVIGVILMVAITVILAAVIAAFVLDLGQSQSASAQAGVDFNENGDLVTVQLIDKGNSDEVWVQVTDASDETDYLDGDDGSDSSSTDWTTGQSVTIDSAGIASGDGDLDSGKLDDLNDGDSVNTITVIGVVDGDETVVATWEP